MIVWYAGVISLVVITVFIVLSLYFATRAPSSEPTPSIIEGLYKIRSGYFVILVLAIVATLTVTLSSKRMPYPELQKGEPDVVVEATGITWSWDLKIKGEQEGEETSAEENGLVLPAGKIIEFQVNTEDVTHGFGVYNSDGKLLLQTQVMPGYTNKVRHVFKPGTYHVFCMEYCGQLHQNMFAKFTVQ